MNYKLIRSGFTELKEKSGMLENNGKGYIEVAITSGVPKEGATENCVIENSGKLMLELKPNEKAYGRSIQFETAEINVVEIKPTDTVDMSQYYKKSEVDNKFVVKEGLYATAQPKANGSAAVGTSTKVAREDHVHPKQTDITGNSATADKLKTPRNIAVSGAVTGNTNFDGSANVTITTELSNIDGNKVNKLTGYSKASAFSALGAGDSLTVALGKLEKGIEEAKAPVPALAKEGKHFSFHYCTKSEYETLEKTVNDSIIYLILDELTGLVEMKVFRGK